MNNISRLEAACDYFLESKMPLTGQQHEQLIALNWHLPSDGAANYQLTHPVDSEHSRQALADLLATSAQAVYGATTIDEKGLILEFA